MTRTIAVLAVIAAALTGDGAQAASFTYNRTTSNTSGTADPWSAGTNWNAIPVSAPNTTLTFGNGASLAAGATIFTNNDFVGDFQLNRLNFTYASPGGLPFPQVTISGSRLEFISDGATTPVLAINPTGQVSLRINNDLLLTNNLTISQTSAPNATFAGSISGSGSLSKTGSGVLSLAGANTYSGGTVLSAGRLELNNSGSGGTSSAIGTGTLTINGGQISNGSGSNVALSTNNAQIWAGDFSFGNSVGTNGSLDLGTGAVTLTGNRTLTLPGGDDFFTVGGAIGDGGSGFGLTIQDDFGFALTLTGASTYSGGTTIARGGLRVAQIGDAGSAGLGTGGITLGTGSSTATLRYIGSGETTDKTFTLGGTGIMQIDHAGTGLLEISSDLAVTGAVPKKLALTSSTFATGEISGLITGNDIEIHKDTTGTWILSGDNTFTTKVFIHSGTLSVSSLNSVVGGSASSNLGAPTTVAAGTIDFGGGLPLPGVIVREGATLRYTGTGETTDRVINKVGDAILVQAGTGQLEFTSDLIGNGDLRLQGSTSGTGEISGVIGGAAARVFKDGAGTWTLSGANTYTAETFVTGGTLLIDGDQSAATGAVTVFPAATLGGTGTIGGALDVRGGTISPGAGIETLTLSSSATVRDGTVCVDDFICETILGTYLVDIFDDTSDLLAIAGALDLSSPFDRIAFNGTPDGITTYVLATYASLAGTFDAGDAPSGYQLVYGANRLDLAPIPEPATVAPMALGLATMAIYARRSRASRRRL